MKYFKIYLTFPAYIFFLIMSPACIFANIIEVSPTESDKTIISKIEGAQAGDRIKIAPGTYKVRIRLTNSGKKDAPIIVEGSGDSRPRWDLSGHDIDAFPGSKWFERSAWQIEGKYIEIRNIEFLNAHLETGGTAGNGSGIRLLNARDITIENCLFKNNDNGIQGHGENVLVQRCQFQGNGETDKNPYADSGHNIYTHSGSWTFRFCSIIDSKHQNAHCRGSDIRFEYCWFENEGSYALDLMTSQKDHERHGGAYSGAITLLGCVVIQAKNPKNTSKIVALSCQPRKDSVALNVNLYYCTVIGNGSSAAIVRTSKDHPFKSRINIYNSLFQGIGQSVRIDSQGNGFDIVSDIRSNIWPEALKKDLDAANHFPQQMLFADAIHHDYRLTSKSEGIGLANANLGEMPRWHIIQKSGKLEILPRNTAQDVGAYEHNQ